MKSRNNTLVIVASAGLSVMLILGAFLAVWLTSREPAKAAAQDNGAQTAGAVKPAQITVMGTGTISVKPDILKVNAGVSIQEATITGAQGKVDTAMAAILARLKAAGIDEKDYRTTQYTVEPVMDFDNSGKGGTAKMVGFRITNMLEITIRDITRAAEILDSLVNAGANNIWGTSYSVAEPQAIAKQSYDDAMKDAQSRADRIASLSGLTLGKIVSVNEGGVSSIQPYDKGMGGAGTIVPGSQSVQTTLVITYEAAESK